MKDEDLGAKAGDLRKMAEQRLARMLDVKGPSPHDGDPHRMIHELQVHQIELEMQNEELMQARMALELLAEKYSDLYDFAPVGYFTLSEDGMILEANLLGAALLGVDRSLLTNRKLAPFVSAGAQSVFSLFLKKVFGGGAQEACEVALAATKANPLHVRIEAAVCEAAGRAGRQCRMVMTDITGKVRKAREKDILVKELKQALADVKSLQGLLPICAKCKKIRDDQGYWRQIEAYIEEHSEAVFSHSMCPECMKILYPDL